MAGKPSTWSLRSGERRLLIGSFLVILAGYAMPLLVRYSNAPTLSWTDALPLAGFAIMLLLGHGLLVAGRFHGDQVLYPVAMLLAGLGWLAQIRLGTIDLNALSLSAAYLPVSGWGLMIGTALFLSRGRAARLEQLSLLCLFLSVAVLGAILVFGQRFRGALYLPGGINPAEIVKLLLIIFLSGFLVTFRKELGRTVVGVVPAPPWKTLLGLGALWALPMGLLVLQRDLGMILLLNLVLLALLVLITGQVGYLLLGLLATVTLGVAVFSIFPHGQARFAVWLDPFADPTGKGWQILQSLSAMYSGGLWGRGLGAGSPSAIPIAESDFVYAAWAEEAGFIGCGLLLLAFALLFSRGLAIAEREKDPFSRNLAAAIVLVLSFQALLNLGGVTKAIPMTGIPLPFISHGGSSLITTFLLVGTLLGLSDGGKPARPSGGNRRPRKTRRR
ncbi:MAG: FtsW/RodA/SpoVE family cell cycle protein [Verrucomicrobia bacterium]|nr:FtsW/RodA/SpoVE family cell cycle protein [Verrucomicrobiota bacterium]